MALPLGDGVVDLAFSSNVLEHVANPAAFLDESLRVTRSGGVVYVSYTIWLSPWGGHETSPWHLLGGHYAARRYEKKHERKPNNLFGESLFQAKVKDVMALVRARSDVARFDAFPRYYPTWMRWVIYVPLVRELVTWNLVVVMVKEFSILVARLDN
jgi:SAM-dependent methyltransferase